MAILRVLRNETKFKAKTAHSGCGPISVSSIIKAFRPTNISMIIIAMLISGTIIIAARYMAITGLSSSIQLSLIIDWERSRLSRGAWPLLFAAELSHMT